MTSNLTAFHNDLVTDTLYAVVGSSIVPLFSDGPLVSTWRSKVFVLHSHPSFGWMRINGDPAQTLDGHTATVRLFGDGSLFYETTVVFNVPVRIPVGRFREWQLEIETDMTIVTVDIATDVKELL